MKQGGLLEQLLAWERELLVADSFRAWIDVAAEPPGVAAGDRVVTLLLADPTFELRHLAAGTHGSTGGVLQFQFVESLAGFAPQVAALHSAWGGEYCAADHALLFPGVAGPRHVLMLPLRRGARLVGAYCVASPDRVSAMAEADPGLLDHLAAVISASLELHFEHARTLRGGLVDAVTGWHSGHYLEARMREEIARCQRYGGSVSCLVVDVDRLCSVNEELGQPAGDAALRDLASRIESQVRASDAAARIGSDEFAVLLPSTQLAHAVPLAQRILAAVAAAPIDVGGGRGRPVTVSIGIAGLAQGARADRKTLSDQLIVDAVAALHRVKQRGGGGYEIAS
jgi:diguanylate cyclase (GGDEF)-like protein